MTDKATSHISADRYGPRTFSLVLVHIFVVELATWLLMPYSIVFVLPVVLVYMAIAAFLAWAWPPGAVGRLGRAMFIGSLSGPLSLILFGTAFAIAHAIGPL